MSEEEGNKVLAAPGEEAQAMIETDDQVEDAVRHFTRRILSSLYIDYYYYDGGGVNRCQ